MQAFFVVQFLRSIWTCKIAGMQSDHGAFVGYQTFQRVCSILLNSQCTKMVHLKFAAEIVTNDLSSCRLVLFENDFQQLHR